MTLASALTALLSVFAQADAAVPPSDPAIERASFVLPKGFTAELWASDPMIAKPIQMSFAPDGRLWVATSRTYPQVEVGQVGDDQIVVLDDTDGDGRADSRTVFADGLLIPTGIAPGDGGCYVANSTELLHLSDTDGDGQADRKRIVLSGFGTEDTHHLIHTFRWSPDVRLNFAQSIYIHSHLETPHGVRRLNAGGFWQLQPDSLDLNVFAYGLVNPWGLAWTDAGQTFATDGAGGEGINYVLPGGYYKTAADAPRLLSGLNPGSPKHCGLEIVGGEALPEDWQGSFLTCDFRGNRVCRFVVNDRAAVAKVDPAELQATDISTASAGWSSREMAELIKSDFVAFRPVDIKQGPDGALYIADWYNPIIQHGEVDFRDERRDRTHGRIWRVTYEGRTADRVGYDALSNADLFATLAGDWDYARRQARVVLSERLRADATAASELRRWVRGLDQTTTGYWLTRLNAAWVMKSAGLADPLELDLLLRCGDADVRAAAYRMLGELGPEWASGNSDRLQQSQADVAEPTDPWIVRLQQGATDYSPRVRLEAVRAAGAFDSVEATAAALRVLEQPMDEWLDYALFLTTRETAETWLLATRPREGTVANPFGSDEQLLFALQSTDAAQALGMLVELLVAGRVPTDRRGDLLQPLARRLTPPQLATLLRGAAQTDDSTLAADLLRTLRQSPRRRSLTGLLADEDATRLLAADGPQADETAALLLGLRERPRAARDHLVRRLREAPTEAAPTLVAALFEAGNNEAAAAATEVIAARDDAAALWPEVARRAPKIAGQRIVESLRTSESPADYRGAIDALLRQKEGPGVLLGELGQSPLEAEAARVLLAAVRGSGQPRPQLEARITQLGNLDDAKRLYSPELLASVKDSLAGADPHRGEAIYRRSELACLKCHAIGGAGGVIGPEMRSLGAASPLEYIVESVVAPNARVKEGYNALLVRTDDGQVLSGVPLSRTDRLLVLRDANGRELRIDPSTIDAEKPTGSLMPAGLVDRLTDQEFVDLIAFLAALGRQPDFTVRPEPVVRRVEVMTPEQNAAYTLRRRRYAAAATDPELFLWDTAYSRVDGTLPLAELPNIVVKNRSAAGTLGVAFVRVAFEQTDRGLVPLAWDGVAETSGWVDGQPVTPELTLEPGRHTLTLALPQATEVDQLRLTFDPERSAVWPE